MLQFSIYCVSEYIVMRLKEIAKIQSGYITRGRIAPREEGTHLLLQARDIDADRFSYSTEALVRFIPTLSDKDWLLKSGDILFMARGAKNHSVMIGELPGNVLAAACFFVVRATSSWIIPGYLCWYLNQSPVQEYLKRFSGQGVNMPVVRRSVLESIEIPIPTTETQKHVSEMNQLMQSEQDLYRRLSEKRKDLITQVCLKAASEQI